MIRYDQLKSARICNKSSNLSVKARINHGQWSAMISKIKRFTNTQARSHTSEGEVPNPCDHPASRHKGFGVIRWPHKTQPVTSIGSILTLPTLHLATLKSYAKVHQSFKKINWTHWLVCCYFSFFPSLIPNFLGIPHTTEIIIGLIPSCVEKCNQKDWFL